LRFATLKLDLIPEEDRKSEDFDKIKSKVTIVAVVILVLTAISAFVTLAFFGYYVSKRQELVERVESAVADVNTYKSAEELLVVAKDKASAAISITTTSGNKVNFLNTFVTLIPQDVFFSDLKLSDADITLTGRARTSADVAGLISSLMSSEGAKLVTDVNINSLSSDATGEYAFGLTAKLK
jgi:Tfp pilus assembly protein PilN